MRVVVAIPAFNSEKTIRKVYDQIAQDYKKDVILSARVIHGEDTESADARVGDWCGLVARRWVFEEAGAACGSRSLARICAIAGIAVECG